MEKGHQDGAQRPSNFGRAGRGGGPGRGDREGSTATREEPESCDSEARGTWGGGGGAIKSSQETWKLTVVV